jgi:hypothetical protein
MATREVAMTVPDSCKEPLTFDDDFTSAHALHMLDFYCKTLEQLGYAPEAFDDVDRHLGESKWETPKFDTLRHAHWMVHQAVTFLGQGRMAKAYRWIGTIQGILFMNGVFSLMELKQHNRFDLPAVKPRRG